MLSPSKLYVQSIASIRLIGIPAIVAVLFVGLAGVLVAQRRSTSTPVKRVSIQTALRQSQLPDAGAVKEPGD